MDGVLSRPYQGLARFYDRVLGRAAFHQSRRRFEWLTGRFGLHFGSAADAACGTGLFLRYLGRWTPRRTGVDRSPDMLLRARWRNPSPAVLLLCQDLRAMRLPARVDLITCNFDALNYLLTGSDLAAALACFRRSLNPGGHLVFDIVTRLQGGPTDRPRFWRGPDFDCRWQVRRDAARNLRRAVLEVRLRRPDRSWTRLREVHLQRPIAVGWMRRLLRRLGFRPHGVFDAKTLGPVGSRTRRVLFWARPGDFSGESD